MLAGVCAAICFAALSPAPLSPRPTPGVAAHEIGQSYMFLRIYDDSVVVRLEITVADLEAALGFGWDLEAGVALPAIESRLDSIRAYVEPRFSLSADGAVLAARYQSVEMRFLDFADFVLLEYVIDGLEEIPDEVDAHYSVLFEVDSQHRNFLVIEHNWKTATFNNEANISLIFTPRTTTQSLDLTSSSVWRGFAGLIWLGVWHIWIGIDHILFLLALVLPSVLRRHEGKWEPVPRFRTALINIVTIVTFFTIAHSVTLSMAALDVVRLSSRFVESVIAGSIAVAAWANLMPRLRVKEWMIAFAFGLFHGFGFASVLGDIGIGRDHLVLSLLGFNVGVEIGQIVIVAAIFPVLFLLRKAKVYPWILKIGSILLIAVALLWFFERLLGFNVPLRPIVQGIVSWVLSPLMGGA